MPDSLQQGPTGELLQGRADSCEEWADSLEGVDLDVDEPTEDDAIEDIGGKPTADDVDDANLNEGETVEEHFAMMTGEWEQELDAKLEELRADWQGKIEDAISELQGYSYGGE